MVPCNHAHRKESMFLRTSPQTGVAPSGDSLRSQSATPWLPLWGSCHEVTERANRTLSAPFRGVPLPERQDPHGYLPFCVCFGTLHFPGNVQCLPQEEVRPSVPEQQRRHPQQQLGVAGRVVQGQTEVPLHPANPVEHRVPVGKKHLAGLFQRAAAG